MITKKAIIDGDVVCVYASSNILATKYSKGSKSLVVTFNYGVQYEYSDVSESEYKELETSDSQGHVFNTTIKSKTFTKLGNVDTKQLIETVVKHSVPVKEEMTRSEKQLITMMEAFLIYHKTKTEINIDELTDLQYFVDKVITGKDSITRKSSKEDDTKDTN